MAKPLTLAEYDERETLDCERLLVTLLAGFGDWRESVYLIGGLVPRYLVPQRPPVVPPHAGTTDVDVVFDLQIVGATEAYRTIEESLKRMGFERGYNERNVRVSWKWQVKTGAGHMVVVEFLVDDPERSNERVMELQTETGISVMNIPHSSMVFDHHRVREIRADLLAEGGVQVERVRHADLVSFTCLKALAILKRKEAKDAHDLVYCLAHAPEGLEAIAGQVSALRGGKYDHVLQQTLQCLAERFASDGDTEGYQKSGPVSVAQFEIGPGAELREARILRQREVSDLVERFLQLVG